MALVYVHVSDIHFGQEKGGTVHTHDDVRNELIQDAARLIHARAGGKANGVIVTGDIAYAGKLEDYKKAAIWLDQLTAAIGCEKTDVLLVPGNHDVDRQRNPPAGKRILTQIVQGGQVVLDEYLGTSQTRDVVYERFADYLPFAEGYNCPLDRDGGFACSRLKKLAPGRSLRFVGLNSALVCSEDDEEGMLLLGEKQRILPRSVGEELVVLCHHPLHWFQDAKPIEAYVRSRARLFLSGHEHSPSMKLESVGPGCDLLMISAGAAVPPTVQDGYTFTYNLIAFDWDAGKDALVVRTIPRIWSTTETAFVADTSGLGEPEPVLVLGCPNFRDAAVFGGPARDVTPPMFQEPISCDEPITPPIEEVTPVVTMPEEFPLLLLRYFRDLTQDQRLRVLVRMNLLPEGWPEPLSQAFERRLIDRLAMTNRLEELDEAITQSQAPMPEGTR